MPRRGNLAVILRHREARLLHMGQSISAFGDGVGNIALSLVVLETTHSASALGIFAAARMAPLVAFLLLGGAVVDRFSRRTLMMISDTGRGLITLIMTILLVRGALSFGELLAGAVGFGVFDALFMPAVSALIPEIVDTELLVAMNGVRSISNQLFGSLIGPAVGGMLSAVSTSWAVGVDAVTFGAALLCALAMRPTQRPAHAGGTVFRDLREGFRFFRCTAWFRITLLAVACTNAFVFSPMTLIATYLMRHTFHDPKSTVGLVFAAMGASSAVAGYYATRMKMPKKRVRFMWLMWISALLSVIIIAFAMNVWPLLVAGVIGAPFLVLGNAVWESLMQSEVPTDFMGRASSVDWFLSLGLAPIGLLLAGAFVEHFGARSYLEWAVLIGLVPSLWALTSRPANAVDHDR